VKAKEIDDCVSSEALQILLAETDDGTAAGEGVIVDQFPLQQLLRRLAVAY
jgi:hypothetical protein